MDIRNAQMLKRLLMHLHDIIRKLMYIGLMLSISAHCFAVSSKKKQPKWKTIFDEEILIPADKKRGYIITHPIQDGDCISLKYLRGTWKAYGMVPSENPDATFQQSEANRLVVALFNKKSSQVLSIVSDQTKISPFKYTVPFNTPLCLRINSYTKKFIDNPGEVVYQLRIKRPLFTLNNNCKIPKFLSSDKLAFYRRHHFGQLKGKNLIVSGLISSIRTPEGNKIHISMYKKLNYGLFDMNDNNVTEVVDLYHQLKKEKCNKPSRFCDYFIKLQISGKIIHGVGPSTLMFLNPKIIYYMAVQVNKPAKYRGSSIGDQGSDHIKNNKTMSFHIVNIGGTPIYPPPPPPIQSPTLITGKVTKSSKWSGDAARIRLHKKAHLKMGNDPLSFYPEIHFIDSRMHWKSFFHNLRVTFEASPSTELRGMYKSYKNARIVEWKSMIDNVYIYRKSPEYPKKVRKCKEKCKIK